MDDDEDDEDDDDEEFDDNYVYDDDDILDGKFPPLFFNPSLTVLCSTLHFCQSI